MTDRPILFSSPMVRAILEGRKTQTRRVLRKQPPDTARYTGIHFASDEPEEWFFNSPSGPFKTRAIYAVGDRLWVREAFHATLNFTKPVTGRCAHLFAYQAGGVDREFTVPGIGRVREFSEHLGGWDGRSSRNYPSIHMPRWASRLTLEVTDVRVQRLQEISEADALAEGVEKNEHGYDSYILNHAYFKDARMSFSSLRESINGLGSWAVNPWVVAITFERIETRSVCEAA